MPTHDESPHPRRPGQASPILVVLLVGILLALIALVAVLATRGGDASIAARSGAPPRRAIADIPDGKTITRAEAVDPPPAPKPIGDPDRIRQTLLAGRTYHVVLKAGVDARVEDRSWGIKKVVGLAYAAEMALDRTIESNDGRRVVELRRFVASRNAKLLCDVEDVKLDLGARGKLALGVLDRLLPGTTEAVATVRPIAESILTLGTQGYARDRVAKAFTHVDSIAGKTVRIAYVDGVGVESIMPVGCLLTDQESQIALGTAILSDCYLLPDLKVPVGKTWTVDGAQLAGFLDPSMRGRPSGEVVVGRKSNGEEAGKPYATLEIRGGQVMLDATDRSTRRIGRFSPTGRMRFRLDDQFVDQADLGGRFAIEEVSTDHLLFETSFRTEPNLRIEFTSELVPAEAASSPR